MCINLFAIVKKLIHKFADMSENGATHLVSEK